MNAKIKMCQHVIFIKPQKFDTANMKCFTVVKIHKTDFDIWGLAEMQKKTLLYNQINMLR